MYISNCDNSLLAQSPFLRSTMRPVTKGELSHGWRRRFGRCTLYGGIVCAASCRLLGERNAKKTANPFRAKKTNGRQSNGGVSLKMTDRDRDRFLAALDRPPR